MAISPVIANCVEVRLLWSINGQGAVNVLHGQVGTFTSNQATCNTLGAAIKAAFTSNLGTLCTVNTILARVGLRDLRQANQTEYLDTGSVVPGTGTGDALPAQIAMCLTLRTALSGKSYRGRIYLGGFSETQSDVNGQIIAGATTAALAFMTAVQNAMSSSQITLGIASRPAEAYTIVKSVHHADGTDTETLMVTGKARTGGITPVTAVVQRDVKWETQRRRMNGRGPAQTLLGPVAAATFDVHSGAVA